MPEFTKPPKYDLVDSNNEINRYIEQTKRDLAGVNFDTKEPEFQEYTVKSGLVTACIIAHKSESIETIAKCVNSAFTLCDDVCLLVTDVEGESEILQQNYFLELYEKFPGRIMIFFDVWKDDFAYSRNACKAYARGTWILSIDCDETLVRGFDIMPFLVNAPDDVGSFVIDVRGKSVDGNKETEVIGYLPRIFRNIPEFYWEQPLHESVNNSVFRNNFKSAKLPESIYIEHEGYEDPVKNALKWERNFGIVSKHIEQKPDCELYLNRANLWLVKQNFAEAANDITEALKLLPQDYPDKINVLLIACRVFAEINDWENYKTSALRLLIVMPNHVTIRWDLIGIYLRIQEYDEAFLHFCEIPKWIAENESEGNAHLNGKMDLMHIVKGMIQVCNLLLRSKDTGRIIVPSPFV